MPDAKATLRTIITELVERTNTDARRLRVLEQRSESLTAQMNTVEETVLKTKKDVSEQLAGMASELEKQSDRLEKVEKAIDEIVKQLKKTASITQMKELEEFVEIYSPLKSNFITREQAETMIEEKLKRQGQYHG
ncbi:MAG: hypothetical protein HYX24_03520 [Candidatus Aenigmarchaeota archaeon]|nr:hypothetical protein [Candidatus Aenigmarchaeota archaeon]